MDICEWKPPSESREKRVGEESENAVPSLDTVREELVGLGGVEALRHLRPMTPEAWLSWREL